MKKIPMFYPFVPKAAIKNVVKVLNSKFIGQGPQVDKFEKEFAKKFKVKYAVALNSCSAALDTALELLNIKKGDEVISTPLTCTATNLPILRRGAKIIFADILENTLNIDPKDIKRKITVKTKAIINVHLGGIENDIGKMSIPIISDEAQSLGVFKGDYICCSFQAIKHITTGDGGMLIVKNKEDYKKAKLIRWFGIDREKKLKNNWQPYKQRKILYDINLLGYKRQMTDIAAVMGLAGLKEYNKILTYRKKVFEIYKSIKNPLIKLLDGEKNFYGLATLLVENRDKFAKYLLKNHIETNLVQVRNDIYSIFGGKRQNLPTLNKIENKYISIPLHNKMTLTEANYIKNIINQYE